MRCLTLADELRNRGAECHFICRQHSGNLIDLIRGRGFVVVAIPNGSADFWAEVAMPTGHAQWLGCDWQTDAKQTLAVIKMIRPDWLVVDHYAIDGRWEKVLRPKVRRMLVIDDLANRTHLCDLLLDQNLGRGSSDYAAKVPPQCVVLAGPRYALLRREFQANRRDSLLRRKNPKLRRLLVSMGGIDTPNATVKVLEALKKCALPEGFRILVVMGPHAPWLTQVEDVAITMPWHTEVRVGVDNMALLMAKSDMAIGAAGSTVWELCCLGVPSLIIVLAENQRPAAAALVKSSAIRSFDLTNLAVDLKSSIENIDWFRDASEHASEVCDGRGCQFIVEKMYSNLV
jgi:UDP-2,4-diacetamido-2,4,6-trideoxy-beta-L-altropyranose hydrolase